MDEGIQDARLRLLVEQLAECRQREGRLHLVTDSLPALLSYVDAELRYQFNNRAYEQWFGLGAAQVRNRGMAEIFGPAAYAVLRPFVERALSGETVRFDAEVPYRTGARWVEVVYVPDLDEAGRVRGIAALTEDVSALSEHRRVAADLRRSNELLERLFDTVHFLLAYMDSEFNFIRVNRAYSVADGRPAGFFPGKNHFDLYPHAENERMFRRVVATGEACTVFERPFEYPEHPERGVTYWDWTVQPVKDAQGEVEGLVLLLVDVTEKARAHRRVESAVVDLRRRAALMRRAEEVGELGYWQDDLRTHEVLWSEGVFRLLGLDGSGRREFSYGEFEMHVHPDDWPELRRRFDAAAGGRTAVEEMEFRVVRANGEERVLLARGDVEYDPSAEPIYVFWVIKDVTAIKRQAALEQLATSDPLTGAANRHALERYLERELRRESRHGHTIAAIMIDVDAFKSFNDLYGHPQGDECLRLISGAIQSRLHRPSDLLVRYGGEEFLVVLPETELGAARQLAEEMREAVTALRHRHAGSPTGQWVSVSLGVAAARAQLGGFEALLAQADAALYRAKAHGRNRVETTPE